MELVHETGLRSSNTSSKAKYLSFYHHLCIGSNTEDKKENYLCNNGVAFVDGARSLEREAFHPITRDKTGGGATAVYFTFIFGFTRKKYIKLKSC